ncbi:MAG: Na+/H+ antiporter NhaC family protein [Oscillospiraceae bacterium]|nr:Na+/H+ antiporter NhaC family protein [Oscillospiraceae bacterium]
MNGTFWAMVPPLLAIIISLITKEVNLSLLIGILVGAGIFTGFNPFSMISTSFDVMANKVHGNMGVLIFIVLLGMIVYLMNLSGATHRYAQWAGRRITSRRQTLLATMALGIIIFVDDYFNCLTVGTVMGPIADRNKISREKLAYIIDCTAAPICIIAPISSWAAAVTSSLPDGSAIDGFKLFLQAIPYNFYSLFTLALILITSILAVDFGKMRRYELEARARQIVQEAEQEQEQARGKVIDLILPIVGLIVFSLIAMLYTGGFFDGGMTIGAAFADCDAIMGLAMGAFYTVILMAILYLPRKIVTPKVYLDGLVQGFVHMVPATLILVFAWTLGGICGGEYLDAGGFVARLVSDHNVTLNMMPAIFFLVAIVLSFSTGTSWGTFAIMLPIAVSVIGDELTPLMALTTAAVLGGSVCGDHLSPISDTTILSSTGAGCVHINHVESQLPYGALVAAVSFACYLFAGFVTISAWVSLAIGIVVELLLAILLKARYAKAK